MPAEDLAPHLRRALEIAVGNADRGGRPFGAVVVRDGLVLGEGTNTVLHTGDPTGHAEVEAVRAASRHVGTPDLAGAIVVASCEPCPMCVSAAVACDIERIVFAATAEEAAAAGFPLSPTGARLRDATGAAGVIALEHVETDGDTEPFARFAAHAGKAPPNAAPRGGVHELRFAWTVHDYEGAARFYRDVLGLSLVDEWVDGEARGMLLEAGRATLELLSPAQAELIDRVEVGRRVAGPVRVALEVDDSAATADRLEAAGARRLGGPVVTPWLDRNVRLEAPDGLQLTLFTVVGDRPTDLG